MRTMRFEIKPKNEIDAELKNTFARLDQKKSVKFNSDVVYFTSFSLLRKILTDKKLEIWRTIRDQKPESITKLAKIVKRSFRTVHRDVMILEGLGLVYLNPSPGKRGKTQKVISKYDELILAVA